MRNATILSIAIVAMLCSIPLGYSLGIASYTNDDNIVTTGVHSVSLELSEPGESRLLYFKCYSAVGATYHLFTNTSGQFHEVHGLSYNPGSGATRFVYKNSFPQADKVTAEITVSVSPAAAVKDARLDMRFKGQTDPATPYFDANGVARATAVRTLTYDEGLKTYISENYAYIDLLFDHDITFNSGQGPRLTFNIVMTCGTDVVSYNATHYLS